MNVFEYNHYRKLILDLLFVMDAKARGQNGKLAKALGVHTSQISQILKGTRDLNLEQAYEVTQFFSLNTLQSRFFITLVSLERAGSHKLKKHYQEELIRIKREAALLENRLQVEHVLDEEKLAVFYSSPLYSEVRLLLSIKEFQSFDKLKKYFQLSDEQLLSILHFLEQNELIVREGKIFRMGPAKTHLPKTSPMILQLQKNWRLKAMEKQRRFDKNDFYYTGPMVLAEKDFDRIKEIFKKSLEEMYQVLEPSPCEKLYCVNLDCFEVMP